MGLAVFAWFWLPTHIGNAWFLTPEEKAWAVERIARDSGGEDYQKKGISRNDMKIAFKDWKLCEHWCALGRCRLIWQGTILFIGTLSGVQQSAFGVFLPLIVQQLGWVESGICDVAGLTRAATYRSMRTSTRFRSMSSVPPDSGYSASPRTISR